jgi:uncharacterized lipoprotein
MAKAEELVIVLSLLTGCAFTPQTVTLSPNIAASHLDIGKGRKIKLSVVDERPKEVIGHRGSGSGAGAKITTNQDVESIIQAKISEGLKSYNFVPVTIEEEVQLLMKVDIRLIEYSTSMGFFTGGVHVKATLKVFCKNDMKDFEKIFRSETNIRTFFVPTAAKNNKLINDTVSQVLQEVLYDKELLGFFSALVPAM